jgi:cell pole-organizing protein PopZ
MDRLASCYFCGDAFDASLSEYPVVPEELQPPEDGPTVVLCGDCREKLEAVIEEVVAATRDDGAGGTATAAREAERDTQSTNGADSADSSGSSLFDDGEETPTTDANEWESPVSDDSDDEASGATDADTPGTGEASTGTTTANGTSDTGAADSGGAEDGPTLSKLEYNKVMRLLKNRPFPVDRAEIRDVATSAYDIGPDEFDAVIEAAIERDLLAVENGQFVDPK